MNKASSLIRSTRESVKGLAKVPDHCIIVGCIITGDAKDL